MASKYHILRDVYCGFHCPRGWYPLVDKLCADLEAAGYTGKVAQVKQKFGTLRFYADDTEPHHDALIHAAEKASATTCKGCGAPGKCNGYMTACGKC